MADLNDLQRAEAIKIVGSDSTGLESNAVKATPNGDLRTSDILDAGGVNANLTVGVAAVELRVGGSRLVNRKYVQFQSKDSGVFYGFSSAVTTANGIEIFKDQLLMMPVGENTQVWFIATVASRSVRIAEIA